MAIDITNKNEKKIALTGAEIEETLLQAHLSKDAIAKIDGLEASASEIDSAVNAIGKIRYYIDNLDGYDTNDGLSESTPFKTISKINTIMPLADGSKILLKTNRIYYETLNITGNNIFVSKYDIGNFPIIDASKECSNFTRNITYSNVFQCNIELEGGVKSLGNLYDRDGNSVYQVSTLLECSTTPNSCYVSNWQNTTAIAYINYGGLIPSGFSYSSRLYCIYGVGENIVVDGVLTKKQAHQDGSISITGDGAILKNAEANDGTRHSVYLSSNCQIENYKLLGGRNDLEPPKTANLIVINQPIVAGTSYRSLDVEMNGKDNPLCTGFQNHGADANELFDSITHIRPIFNTLNSAFNAAAINTTVDGATYIDSEGAYIGRGTTVTLNHKNSSGNILTKLYNAEVPCTINSTNNNIVVDLMGGGVYNCDSATSNSTINIKEDTITALDGVNPTSIIIRLKKGSLSINESVFKPFIANPLYYFINAGISGNTATISGDNNIFPKGAKIILNGTTYNGLAAAQLAGYFANSVIGDTDADYEDDFVRTDEYLDTSTLWTRIDGIANQAQVVSNALSIVGSTETLYTLNGEFTENQYVEFSVGTVNTATNNFVVVRGIDKSNFIGVRFSTTVIQIYNVVNGAFNQITNYATPVNNGDEITLAVRNKKLYAYHNDKMITSLISLSLTNSSLGKVGVVARGGAITNYITNIKAGNL